MCEFSDLAHTRRLSSSHPYRAVTKSRPSIIASFTIRFAWLTITPRGTPVEPDDVRLLCRDGPRPTDAPHATR
jgi:hypothetical protein